MRTANFRDDVLFQVANLLGVTPDPDLSPERGTKFCGGINRHTTIGWKFWNWPELRVNEERSFRPFWKAAAFYSSLTELFDLTTFAYYRVKSGQMPPAGILPTNSTYFEPFNFADKFIALDTDCRQSIGEVLGVYSSNPRLGRGQSAESKAKALDFRLSEKGIDIRGAGSTVFVLFKIRPSKFTTVPYDNTKNYLQGNLAYFNDDGEVYRARTDAPAGFGPAATAYWAKVPFPERLVDYVTLMTAAENADDQQQAAVFRSDAQDSLVREVNDLMKQGDRHFYRAWSKGHGGWRPSWPCQAASTAETTTLTDECVDEFGDPEGEILVDETGNPIVTGELEPIGI